MDAWLTIALVLSVPVFMGAWVVLKEKVAKAVGRRGPGLTMAGDQVSGHLEWFLMEPERVVEHLDLFCDLADAAERAAASAANT